MKTLKQRFTGFGHKEEVQETVSSGVIKHIHKHENHETHSGTETLYQCPMKCEGEKTYNAPGRCPVCGMNLAPVGS